MKEFALDAAKLMIGLALYHAYGILIILYNIDNWSNIPMFGIAIGNDEPRYSDVRAKIIVIVHLFLLVYALRWLIVGLWKQRAAAWYGSFFVCSLIILSRWVMLKGNSQAHLGHWLVIAYCIIIIGFLLSAAPAFLKQQNGTKVSS